MNDWMRVSVEEMQQNFDLYMEKVEAGEAFVITANGKDKAVLLPIDTYQMLMEEVNNEYL